MTGPAAAASRRAVLAGLAGTLALPAAQAAPPRLMAPVAVEARRKLFGRPLEFYDCPPVPPPVVDLSIEGAYTDKSFSIVDPEKLRRQAEAARPLGAFTWQVAKTSDLYMLSRPMRTEPAACLLNWLDTWARAGAMLGKFDTADAQHHRRWTLCGIALAYLKVRDAPGLDPAAKTRVEQWFVKLADKATAYYTQWGVGGYNNHADWWALALVATAVAANDHALFDYAMGQYDVLVGLIQPDGSLPAEMARKSRALGYHLFALTPLVMVAEIGEVNGRHLYAARNGAIHRLARRVLAGFDDPSWFSQHAGAAQEPPPTGPKALWFQYVWAEVYYNRFPDPALGRRIAEYRPLFYHWYGGSVTYAYGSPSLPMPS